MASHQRPQMYTSLAPKWYIGSKYIEITFYGKSCAIIKKVNWTYWRDQVDNCTFLMSDDEQEFFIHERIYIKHYWKLFKGDRDSVDPPFTFTHMRVAKRVVKLILLWQKDTNFTHSY